MDNTATNTGDSIYIDPASSLTLKNIIFRNSNRGRTIYLSSSTSSPTTLMISNNTFYGNGTGIYFDLNNPYSNYSFTNNSFSSSHNTFYQLPGVSITTSAGLNDPASTQATQSYGNTVF